MEKHIEILVDRKEYITKEEAYKTINEQYHEIGFDGYQDGIELMNRIAKIPAADVVEVRHAHWVKRMEHGIGKGYEVYTPIWSCSNCGRDYDPASYSIINYCYICGAKMDGGKDEEK